MVNQLDAITSREPKSAKKNSLVTVVAAWCYKVTVTVARHKRDFYKRRRLENLAFVINTYDYINDSYL